MNSCVKDLAEIILIFNLVPQNLKELNELPWEQNNFE